ncbi:MAG: EAL domain-containing protein [Pseudomonadota bacterium]
MYASGQAAMPHRALISALPPHEATELFRLMVEGIRECAVFLMDTSGVITVWNKAAEEMKGYPAAEVIGQHFGKLYTQEDQARGRPQHNLREAAEHDFYTEETWRQRKDGSLFWAHIAITALRDSKGALLGFSKTTLDLTTHKLLEDCKREKAEINVILEAAESGTWKWNVATDQVQVSHHFLRLLGYGDGDIVLRFEEWLNFIRPGCRDDFRSKLSESRQQAPGSALETELRLIRHDGSEAWFFIRATWHADPLGGASELVGVCVGIDSLKQSQQETERLNQQLKAERARFANILDELPSGVMLADAPSGKLTYQNRAAEQMLGRGLQALDSYREYSNYYTFFNMRGERVQSEDLPLARAVRTSELSVAEELVYVRKDGSQCHFAVTTGSVLDSDGVSRIAIAVLHDVSNLKTAQLQAATEKERAQVTLAAITDGVITIDRSGTVMSINPAAERLIGASQGDVQGKPYRDVLCFDQDSNGETMMDAIGQCLNQRRVLSNLVHATLVGQRGERHTVESAVAPVSLNDGEQVGAVLILHDITESKRLIRRLGFEASHDALTGLVNRREFETRLLRTLERAHHSGGNDAALLYMDLDQFKIVNDSCGHSAGDELLKQLASLYTEHVRERDTLARIGGDEFALIVEHCSLAEAVAVAEKILDATRNFRYGCQGQLFQLGISIGLTPIDRSLLSIEEALRRADHACYIAKESGRNRMYVHYSDNVDFAQRRSDMHWVTKLASAFQNDQLQLYYQPILALGDGGMRRHYEILLRMKNGASEPIGPGTFLPAAERYDVILKIDRWVLKQTLDWLERHPDHTTDLEMCSINLSRRSLADLSFHKFAADLIDASTVPAEKLCFEITENGAIANMQKTIEFIEALSARGCRFSLDDFGSGMTSFAYLKQLPVDFIKIDGSFIQMMSSSAVDYEMVRFTNDISHMMGRKTIAEYVSDPAILSSLREIGVDFAQGYWVGEPRPLTA